MSEMNDLYERVVTEYTLLLTNGNTILWVEDEGVSAQGFGDPYSQFTTHALIKYNGQYFDPSYGNKFLNSNDWETASLAAFESRCRLTRIENGVEKDHFISWIAELNIASPQCNITP